MTEPPATQDRRILGTLWLLVFASASQMMAVAPLLSSIGSAFDVPASRLGALITVYAAAVGVFALIAGPISDRVGRRPVLLWGSALMAIALLLHGLAWDYSSLLVFRALAGVAGGMLSGATVAFVGDWFPSERRGWANGWIMSGFAAGQIIGVPLATVLGGWAGFRIPFFVFGTAMVGASFAVLRFLPHVATGSVGQGVGRALRVYGGLMRRGPTGASVLAYVALFFGIAVFMVYLPAWLEGALGFSTLMVAGVYLAGGVGTVYAGPRAGALSDRLGRLPVILWASGGLVLLTLLTPAVVPVSVAIVFPAFVGVNVFLAARASAFQALLTELVDGAERGAFMSLTTATGQVGFALGAAAAGPSFVAHGFMGNAVIAALAAACAGAVIWAFLRRPKRARAKQEGRCPCNQLQMQSGQCGPLPEAGHMASCLQEKAVPRSGHLTPSAAASPGG